MQSLLFCQDEKSAVALISLVTELDIVVKHEREVFSAMGRLMAERFDFVIIDYEDEETGRVLLKNARSSAINKTALAVAVVDPETGTDALRVGADFLVMKPIKLGPAGGVLRLVRTSILRSQRFSSPESATKGISAKPGQHPQEATLSPQKSEPVRQLTCGGTEPDTAVVAAVNTMSAKAAQKPICELEAPTAKSLQAKIGVLPALKEDLNIASSRTTELGADPVPVAVLKSAPPKKEKTKSREVTKTKGHGINKRPTQPFMVLLAAIVGIMLLIVSAIALHIHSKKSSLNNSAPVQSSTADSAAQTNASPTQPPAGATAAAPLQAAPEPQTEEATGATPAASPSVPGQVDINSAPGAGQQVQVHAHNNSTSIASRHRRGLAPRKHSVTISKPGYLPGKGTRTKVATGNGLSVRAELAPLTATVSLNSDPANARVWIDGMDTGRMTPTHISVDKPGNHTFVFKKHGYLDWTATANLEIGQTFHLTPSLRVLGRTDEIKMVGKFRKLFGGGKTGGMGIVSVNTRPKGAQIAVNTHIVNKPSPAKFYLNPGNYVIDITLPGLKGIQRVVSVGKGSKVVIDEVMARE